MSRMTDSYQDGLSKAAKRRYKKKLELAGLEQCPYTETEDKWTFDMEEWPDMNFGHMYQYLIKSPRLYSKEAMEDFRSLEAYVSFISGWVQTVYHYQTGRGDLILKADVGPSWKVTADLEESYHTWLALKNDGKVITTHCDCMASVGQTCSHIGAVLFKVETAVRMGYTEPATAAYPCPWSESFDEDVEPAPIASINFYSEEEKQKFRESMRIDEDEELNLAPLTKEEKHRFLQSLKDLGTNSLVLSLYSEYNQAFIQESSENSNKADPLPDTKYSVQGVGTTDDCD